MPAQTRDLLSVDEDSFPYIFEQNVTVRLKSSEGLVRVNVYRPRTQEKVPVLATYGIWQPIYETCSVMFDIM